MDYRNNVGKVGLNLSIKRNKALYYKNKGYNNVCEANKVLIKPTKLSNAPHLVEYEKQLLYEENKKIVECHATAYGFLPGINTSSESILIRSYLLFA